MQDDFLYSPITIADAIKQQAKKKKVVIKSMLISIGLGTNTLANLRNGKAISAESLAKISDYLDCSVDYLLGRTNDAEVQNLIELAPDEYPLIVKYRRLDKSKKDIVDHLVDDLSKPK